MSRQNSSRCSNRLSRSCVAATSTSVDSARSTRKRTGANYDATVNSYKVFHNGNQYTTNAGLDSAGDERLEELRARDSLSFQPIQVPSTLYGKHYFLGDKASALFLGFAYTPQVRRVQIDVRNRGNQPTEQIQVTTANV